jgi:hypothetical protein
VPSVKEWAESAGEIWRTAWQAFGQIAADIGMRPGSLAISVIGIVAVMVFAVKLTRARKGG